MKHKISIIIPTLHRKVSMLRLLASVAKQDAKADIVVVEQGYNNGKAYKTFAQKHRLQVSYVHFIGKNSAKARNLGAKQTKGTILVFYDDDVVLESYALENIVRNFEDPTIGCVCGRVLTPGQPVEKNRIDVGRISPWSTFSDGFSSAIRQDIVAAIGCNMAVRKDRFEKVRGFDEQFDGAFREDSDLSLRVEKLGNRVIFDPSAIVTHIREQKGGGRKSEGRIEWYFTFFSNETYFFLKHKNLYWFPVFLATRIEWMLRCMFGFGREVSMRSILTPLAGIMDGVRKYRNYDYWR